MKNPYKELSPYIESDAHRFKGRTSETEEMYESFDRNEYLVCHADSGEGKSSIIEAGLIPKMKANCYFPVRIIFKSDEHFKKNNIDFDNVVCGIIENEIEKLRSNNNISVNIVYPRRLTNSDDIEQTNWEKEVIDSYAWLKLRYARVTIDNLLYTPVLIFDQFEEVFTNPLSQEWTDRFFKWLQELSTDLCPQRIINELEKQLGNDDFPEINTQKYFKAIFSLRSEYVGKLDYWGIQRHYIPLLKKNRYLLRPLTIEGAKEVITQQDGYDGLNAVADEIIDVLRRQQKGKNYVLNENSELPCIPALFLSIICSRAFSMSEDERAAFMQRLVAEKDEDKETAINSLIESFYEKAVADCEIPSKDMGIIEDILVNNEGSRQRVSSHADALKTIDFSTKYMKKLKDARLIRVIPDYNREDDSVEFVHDALCPIIAKRKEERYKAELEKEKRKGYRWNTYVKMLLFFPLLFLIVTHDKEWYFETQKGERGYYDLVDTCTLKEISYFSWRGCIISTDGNTCQMKKHPLNNDTIYLPTLKDTVIFGDDVKDIYILDPKAILYVKIQGKKHPILHVPYKYYMNWNDTCSEDTCFRLVDHNFYISEMGPYETMYNNTMYTSTCYIHLLFLKYGKIGTCFMLLFMLAVCICLVCYLAKKYMSKLDILTSLFFLICLLPSMWVVELLEIQYRIDNISLLSTYLFTIFCILLIYLSNTIIKYTIAVFFQLYARLLFPFACTAPWVFLLLELYNWLQEKSLISCDTCSMPFVFMVTLPIILVIVYGLIIIVETVVKIASNGPKHHYKSVEQQTDLMESLSKIWYLQLVFLSYEILCLIIALVCSAIGVLGVMESIPILISLASSFIICMLFKKRIGVLLCELKKQFAFCKKNPFSIYKC